MVEKLFVPQKQHDFGYNDLLGGLIRSGVSSPRMVADTISKHLKSNTLPSFLAVERWVQRYTDAIPANGYDAFVNFGVVADPSAKSFPTVFEAIRFLDAAGYVTARIAISARGNTITETAALGATTSLISVAVEGIDGGNDSGQWGDNSTQWSMGGFSTTGTGLKNWRFNNVGITIGAGKTSFFQGNNVSLYMENGILNGAASATSTTAPTIAGNNAGNVFIRNTSTLDISPAFALFWDSSIQWNTVDTLTVSGPVWTWSCFYDWSGTTTITFDVSATLVTSSKAIHLVGCTFAHTGVDHSSSELNQLNLTITGAQASTCITGSGDKGAIASLNISVSTYAIAYIDVQALNVTLGAPSSNTTYSAVGHVGGALGGTLDVTGPCSVDVVANAAIGRGNGIEAALDLVFSPGSGTAFQGIAMTDSAIFIGARRHPGTASSTQKGYALDASCARNVVVFAGGNNFPTASTDAGTADNIITENGATRFPSTTVVAGSYGSAVKIPTYTVDASGRLTASADVDPTGTSQDFAISVAGKGLKIKEGSNAKMGVSTLVAGTVTVPTTAVTASSRIFLTVQSLGTILVPAAIAVTAVTAATSFVITSADITDTSVVAWMIVEPA